jgi:hypothetical protein
LFTTGIGHPVKPLPDMRRANAASRERHRPEGVTQGFQVSRNKVDPRPRNVSRNLLSKHRWRAALRDEPMPGRPQVPLVIKPCSAACRAERLAWAGTGPHGLVVGPSSLSKSVGPDADAGEEMTLAIAGEVGWADIADVALVHVSGWKISGCNEVAEPRRSEWINLVVEDSAIHAPGTSNERCVKFGLVVSCLFLIPAVSTCMDMQAKRGRT